MEGLNRSMGYQPQSNATISLIVIFSHKIKLFCVPVQIEDFLTVLSWSVCSFTINTEPSSSSSYNHCNQCVSPLTLRVRTQLRRGAFDTTLCDISFTVTRSVARVGCVLNYTALLVNIPFRWVVLFSGEASCTTDIFCLY